MGFITKKEIRRASQPNVTKKKLLWCVVLGTALLVLDAALVLLDPPRYITRYSARVDYGSYAFEVLGKEVGVIDVSTYLFNVTNAERFQAGLDSKLRVQEVGPFTYQELRKNELLEIDHTTGVMRFTPKIRTSFLRESSVGRPEDINVTMPNIAMLSMASKMSTYPLIPRMGYNLLTARLKSKPIVQTTAEDYMWGYDEPLIRLGNSLLPGWIDFDVLGVMDRLYDKKAIHSWEESARNEDKFAIRTMDGVRGLDAWGYKNVDKRSQCNTFTDAYEGIAYPTEITPGQNIRIYRNVFCRFLELDYIGRKESYGAPGLEYRVSRRTFTRNNLTECLCDRGICQDGISDLSPCYKGLPVVLSNAHFLYADPKLYERIEGLKPDEERHGSSIVIEPKTGMALETKLSVQMNLFMRDVGFNAETGPFSNIIIPCAYFQIKQPRLNGDQLFNLKLMYVIGPAVLLTMEVVLLAISVGLISYSAFMYWHWVETNKSIVLQTCVSQKSAETPLMK